MQNVGGSLLQIKEDWKARCQLFRKFLRAGAGRLVSGVSGDQPGTGQKPKWHLDFEMAVLTADCWHNGHHFILDHKSCVQGGQIEAGSWFSCEGDQFFQRFVVCIKDAIFSIKALIKNIHTQNSGS